MAKRDGAAGAAETVADPADAGPPDGDLALGAGSSPAGGAVDTPGPPAEPVTRDGAAAADEPPAAGALPGAVQEPVAVPAVAGVGAASQGRRAGRFPRPSGPRTPTFGISLAAIRGPRPVARTEGTEELRRSLADTEAQTNELREALDALRQALDHTSPARTAPAEPERPRRRPALILALAASLVAVVVVVALVLSRGDDTVTASPSPAPSATASSPSASPSAPSPSASAAPSVTASATPALTTTPLPWRGGPVIVPPGVPESGPGITAPGTDVTLAIDDDLRHFDVYEQAVLAEPADAVTVSLPPVTLWSGALDGAAEEVRPAVEDLQIEIDGVPVRVQERGEGWFALPPSGSRATKVVLRYRLSGVAVGYAGSPNAARRTVAVPPLTARASLEDSLPVTLRVDDPRVRTMSCTTAAENTVLCGGQQGSTTIGTIPTGAAPAAFFLVDLRAL